MSTKTSFKRIAAVAAVALTLGGFSAVSAHAAITDGALFPTVTSLSAPATGTVGTAVTGTFLQSGVVNGYGARSLYTQAYLTAIPATSALAPNSVTVANYSGTTYTNTTGTTETATDSNATAGDTNYNGTSWLKINTSPAAGATARINGYFTAAFTPDAAGTYTIAVKSLIDATQLATWTITVAAKPSVDAASSTSIIAAGDTSTVGSADVAVAASKTASSTPVASIVVTAKNATPSDLTSVTALTAVITGAGTLSIGSTRTQTPQGRAVTGTAGQNLIQVFADGTAGVGTITISAGTTVLSTETVTFYGSAATITPTVVAPLFAVGTATGAITAVVKDSNGVAVAGTTVYAVSDTVAAVSNSYVSCGSSSATGAVSCDLVGVAAGTANITLTLNSSAAGTSTVAAAPVAVRVGSASAASVKWSLDSATYVPGALVTASVTVLDAAGLPVVPGTYTVFTAAPTFSMAPATTSPLAASVVVAAGSTTGTTTYTFNAPLVAGNLDIKATTATLATAANSAVAVVLSAVIAGGAAVDAAQAAQDAANEATDAANAATDAANNAMDSADAATAAAQDAGDKADAALAAITDLATKVSDIATAVSALSALVSKIAAAVAKISAKVKA